MILQENYADLISKANQVNNQATHWCMAKGQATYTTSLKNLTYLTWEQAEIAINIGVRIGYASEYQDYHGSKKGLYDYYPIRNIESFYKFHKAYDDYKTKYSQQYTSITIDPSYDWVGVMKVNQLKIMIDAVMKEMSHEKLSGEQLFSSEHIDKLKEEKKTTKQKQVHKR